MEARSLVAISPHLDDAVFGCSSLIARHSGAAVIGIFAGIPPESEPLSEWDATCGFERAREAMIARRNEDGAALAELRAEPVWLDLLDAQYRHGEKPGDFSHRILAVLDERHADIVAVPAGLFHEDHELAHACALRCMCVNDSRRWIVYEDALYRRIDGLLAARIEDLTRAGFAPSAIGVREVEAGTKRRAVGRYASQLRGLASAGRPGHDDLSAAEGYWELHP